MPKSYQPGQRNPKYNSNRQFGEDRYAWAYTENSKWVILVGNERSPHGPDVILFHPTAGRLPDISINLTNMTAEELEAIRELLNTALDWAKPVVDFRDKEASDAAEQGDDSFSRLYRAVPTVVYRKRPKYEHDPSLLGGSEDVPHGYGERSSLGRGVRGIGDGVAEPDEGSGGAQDDGEEVDESEDVRTVGLQPPKPLV